MQQAHAPDAALIAAYKATHYEVHAPEGLLLLQIDVSNARLRAVHEKLRVNCSAFLTAWNPRSVPAPEAENAAALDRLRASIAALGLAMWPGWGRDPSGTWAAEESLFVPGIELERATQLARDFDQYAIVHAAGDAIPRLILL